MTIPVNLSELVRVARGIKGIFDDSEELAQALLEVRDSYDISGDDNYILSECATHIDGFYRHYLDLVDGIEIIAREAGVLVPQLEEPLEEC